MTKLLLRLFVKNYEDPDDPKVRAAVGSLAGFTGIFCNVLLFAIKLAASILTGSLSIVADGLNNLTDAASSVVTLFGFHLAKQPADKDHPYGHARYEYLSGLFVAVMTLFIGFELAKTAVLKIITPEPVTFTWLTAGILLVSMGVKLWMCLYFRALSRHIGSVALRAASEDSRNDVIATAAVFLGCLGAGWNSRVDGVMGLGVALFILRSGLVLVKDTISPLLGQQADEELVRKLRELVCSHPQVLGTHDLLVHDYGPGQCFASIHAELSAKEDPLHSHEILDTIEREALDKLRVNLVIHYDPVQLGDRRREKWENRVRALLEQMDDRLALHDFRLEGDALAFDLEMPYDCPLEEEQVKTQIEKLVHSRNPALQIHIQIDKK